MPEWLLRPDHPSQITLAADARLTRTSYTNDQIWEFIPNRGEPLGLSIETTYGLRARSMRLIPKFTHSETSITDPNQFIANPKVKDFYPNYLLLTFSPFQNIEIHLAYWIPTSQTVASRILIRNSSKQSKNVQIEWIAILIPNESGDRMSIDEFYGVKVLWGKTSHLEPVLFVQGGGNPSPGSFPGLTQDFILVPGQTVESRIVLASLDSEEESFEFARTIAAKNWDAEETRIRMVNADRFQILTGNPNWNHCIEMSQTVGASLLISPQSSEHPIACILSRQPDHGFSLRGDGSDYTHLWNGITALQMFFLCEEVMPSQTDICKKVFENFLSKQSEDGFIDWKPGFSYHPKQLAATPILSTLALSLYEKTGDIGFLMTNYPKLRKFFDYWFNAINDLDNDGIPEWRHFYQTGFEENIYFNNWHENTKGIDIALVECPDLCSLLFSECKALTKIADLIGITDVDGIQVKATHLQDQIGKSWQEENNCYHYWDRDTHTIQEAQILATQRQAGDFLVQQTFNSPVRIQFKLTRIDDNTRKVNIFIHGINQSGDRRIERINPERFTWNRQNGFATSEKTYIQLDKIVVEGLEEDENLTIHTVDHNWIDQSLLLPLWAGAASNEHAGRLIHNTILNPQFFCHPNGITSYPQSYQIENNEIQLLYNSLIIRGLVRTGFREQAGDLISRVMNMVSQQLLHEGMFRQTYDSASGLGKGERNTLEGLVPIGALLEVLGITIYNPWKVKISGFNPFSWPVTVKYCGTSILRKLKGTTIIFPDGQSIDINDDESHLVAFDQIIQSTSF